MTEIILNSLQWPAMVATLISAWLVASQTKKVRRFGFASFIISNVLWVIWGFYASAYAVIFLQIGLLFLNIRGSIKNE
jgi:hypothetical protein